jgi:hypothetical protein
LPIGVYGDVSDCGASPLRVQTYSKGALQSDVVLLDGINGCVGDHSLAFFDGWRHVDRLPLDRRLAMVSWVRAPSEVRPSVADLSGGEDSLHTLGDLRTDSVPLDESDSVVSLVTRASISNHLDAAGAVTRRDVDQAGGVLTFAFFLPKNLATGFCSVA